jgi:hypothetical protein
MLRLILLLGLAVGPTAPADGEILLAPGMAFETSAFLRTADAKGPTVVIAVSPHPVDSRDATLRGWVRRSVEWLGRR